MLIVFFILSGCKKDTDKKEYKNQVANADLLHSCADQLTDVIIFDVFKPSVASRIYAYSYLAAYETLKNEHLSYPTFAARLNDFNPVPPPLEGQEYCFSLASLKAFVTVGKTLTFSKDMWDKYEPGFFKRFKEMGVPEDVYNRSVEYGEKVALHIIDYSNKDGYKNTRGVRFTLGEKPGSWSPTPPTYAEACEPKWNSIRTFTLDSCSQFAPPAPTVFDINKNSEFYKLVKEVYNFSQNLTEEQKEIAYFWDDNAMVTNIKGHVSYAEKKMGPGSHWIQITQAINEDQKLDFMQALETYTLVSFAVNDGFIASWDVKYKTDRIRPVTIINNILDNKWLPFLETPPFPEYTSAHSTISAAAGTVLTYAFGENYAFTDSTEFKYGHGVRSFTSFREAYWETSLSRVYGGIHFRDGIEQGTLQGEKIGAWIWRKFKNPEAKSIEQVVASSEKISEKVK